MGQYYRVCNLDKHEYLNTWTFDDGAKLLEFAPSGNGVMTGLAILLASSNGQGKGGGDIHPWNSSWEYWNADLYGHAQVPATGREDYLMNEVVGRWAGDRIAIVGDYHEEGEPGHEDNPWNNEDGWTDISGDTLEALRLDPYLHSVIPDPANVK